MKMKDLKKKINNEVLNNGFDVLGFTKVHVNKEIGKNYSEFLKNNYHGEMKWLERHYEKKINPRLIWSDVKTILVVGQNYAPNENPLKYNRERNKANISVYARNHDYHKIMQDKLLNIQSWLKNELKMQSKVFVDTSPILEKYFAEKANLGWQGKHTNLVSKKYGSWLFLGEIFLPIDIEDKYEEQGDCGTCEKCLDICPTNAFLGNNKIDARKCISYLTIEHKGPIPMTLRKKIGNKVYGCDDCLSICPWNKFSTETKEDKLNSNKSLSNLDFFLNFNKQKFEAYFSESPVKRIGWERFLRNIIIATGNSQNISLIDSLYPHLKNDYPIIRGSCVWSLFQLLCRKEKNKLRRKLLLEEKNEYVIYELRMNS